MGSHDVRHATGPFLETLPVSPSRRFLTRVAACSVAVGVVAVAEHIPVVIQLLRDVTTTPGLAIAGPLAELPGVVLARWTSETAAVVLGVVLSPLRQLTWGVAVGLYIGSLVLASQRPELQGMLPGMIGRPFDVGGSLRIASEGIKVALEVGGLALLIGALIANRRPTRRTSQRPWLKVVVVFGILVFLAGRWKREWEDLHGFTPMRVESRRFVFTVHPRFVPTPAELAIYDADVETIEGIFGHRLPPRLRANATWELKKAHGRAHGLAIAVAPRAVHDRFAVAHEATHAMASAIVGRDLGPGLSIFSEGLANHVARRFATTTDAGHADPMSRLVAHARARQLDNDLLWDEDAARNVGGGLLVYAIGEHLIGAMIEVYGDDAPTRALVALRTTPRHLHGEALWHDMLARSGMLLEPIRARFFARVFEAVDAADDTDDPVPDRPVVAAEINNGVLAIRGLDHQGRAIDGVTCAVRNRPHEDDNVHREGCAVPLSALAGPIAEIQVSAGPFSRSTWTRVALPPR